MPRMTVKALAEMVSLPAQQQLRILHDQKYPKEGPQAFKVPYYRTAVNGIRSYYKTGNNPAVLDQALKRSQSLKLPHMRNHNTRVLKQFRQSPLAQRVLTLAGGSKYEHNFDDVGLRVVFDLAGTEGEGGAPIRSLFHLQSLAIEPALANLTLEFASIVLTEEGILHNPKELEFIDVTSGQIHRTKKVRKASAKKLQDNLTVIKSLWSVC